MEITLSEIEARVLGSLLEKGITTPDYYPLSLNALINACNQRSSREPMMSLDEPAVRDALVSLQAKRLAGPAGGADSRVTKYEHRLQEVYNFSRPEAAVLCVLLLRGPQTPGELRGRSERMHPFAELADVQAALQRLAERTPPLVTMLGRQPGMKEVRYAHLFSGAVESWTPSTPEAAPVAAFHEDGRIRRLEEQLAELQQRVMELAEQVAELRKPLE